MFSKLRRWLFPPKPKRVELRFVPYGEADALLRAGWRLALPEEDNNHVLGMVYLERVEEVK
jgi:hypothetical protein